MAYRFVGIHFAEFDAIIDTGFVIAFRQSHFGITAVCRSSRLAPYIEAFDP